VSDTLRFGGGDAETGEAGEGSTGPHSGGLVGFGIEPALAPVEVTVWGLPWGPRSAWMIGELGEFKFRYAAKSPIFPFKIRVSRLLLDKGPVPLSARSAFGVRILAPDPIAILVVFSLNYIASTNGIATGLGEQPIMVILVGGIP